MLFFYTRKILFFCELFRTGKNSFVHQVGATLQRFNPVQKLGDLLFTHKRRAMLRHNHLDIHAPHHVHPKTNHLVIAHITLMKAFHFWDMRSRIR